LVTDRGGLPYHMGQYIDLRIAWLMPGSGFSTPQGGRYWKVILTEFIRAFPRTIILSTGDIHPYYHETLNVRSVGKLHIMNIFNQPEIYSIGFTWITPKLLFYLLTHNFDVIITLEYSIATLYAAIARCFKKTRIILLKEGKYPIEMRLKRWYKLSVNSKIDGFLANTLVARDYLRSHLKVPPEKIICKPYLVPPEPVTPSPNVTVPHSLRPVFLFVGQLIPRKGVQYLLEAAAILTRQGKSFSIWIVGDGPLRKEIKQRIHNLNLQDVVWLFGSMPYEQVGIFYNASDIFVLPTLSDYRSVAIMEAAKYGKPLLDSKYDGGSHEFVCHGENGFIFDPRDPNELAQLMLRLINIPELTKKFGQKSKEIMEPYTVANAVAAFQECIEHVLKKEQQRR
jgi:glycosyltransferase involved in cell wall biosynthesis